MTVNSGARSDLESLHFAPISTEQRCSDDGHLCVEFSTPSLFVRDVTLSSIRPYSTVAVAGRSVMSISGVHSCTRSRSSTVP